MEMFAVYLIWLVNNRFGFGDFDWKDFIPHMKQKTYEEINE